MLSSSLRLAGFALLITTGSAFGSCLSPRNAIEAENCLAGAPQSQWDITGTGDSSIQGFATNMSVNLGETAYFKVKTTAAAYRLDIYRVGYYGGLGARLVATVNPSVSLPQVQPNCLADSTTKLTDCGNWAISASWTVPANATSGIYFARLVRSDTSGANHIYFIVRNDLSNSDLLFQTSDTTWQAYNAYSTSLYGCPQNWYSIACRAYKVSYNRPFNTAGAVSRAVFTFEYPMVRWLESNGYDVSYISEVDTARSPQLLTAHRAFLSVGHDEYWSGEQRSSVEAARRAGVHLAFFSGNEIFWKTRWENSIDGSNTPYRTLVCYKETHANASIDPSGYWTGTWMDPRFSPPKDGGRPQNALSGTLFRANSVRNDSMVVPYEDGKMRFWRNTNVASLQPSQSYVTAAGILGYEWDVDEDNGFRPAGLFGQSSTTVSLTSQYLLDYGSTYGAGVATHRLTLYRDQTSRSLVFGAGTVQWSWGLDDHHTPSTSVATFPAPDRNLQQATVNLLADMGVQPVTLQTGLATAVQSTDTAPPASVITSPVPGANVNAGSTVTITGKASDTGGLVGGVEVSVDGGQTWHPATGRGNWSYSWTPQAGGVFSLRSRAVDDSGNLEASSAGVAVTILDPVSITVTPSSATIVQRATQQFTATATYQNGSTQKITQGLIWASSNTSVATVDSNGLAKAQGLGTATISATYKSIKGSATLTVVRKAR